MRNKYLYSLEVTKSVKSKGTILDVVRAQMEGNLYSEQRKQKKNTPKTTFSGFWKLAPDSSFVK